MSAGVPGGLGDDLLSFPGAQAGGVTSGGGDIVAPGTTEASALASAASTQFTIDNSTPPAVDQPVVAPSLDQGLGPSPVPTWGPATSIQLDRPISLPQQEQPVPPVWTQTHTDAEGRGVDANGLTFNAYQEWQTSMAPPASATLPLVLSPSAYQPSGLPPVVPPSSSWTADHQDASGTWVDASGRSFAQSRASTSQMLSALTRPVPPPPPSLSLNVPGQSQVPNLAPLVPLVSSAAGSILQAVAPPRRQQVRPSPGAISLSIPGQGQQQGQPRQTSYVPPWSRPPSTWTPIEVGAAAAGGIFIGLTGLALAKAVLL